MLSKMLLNLLFSALCGAVLSQDMLVTIKLNIFFMFLVIIFTKDVNISFSEKKVSTSNAETQTEEEKPSTSNAESQTEEEKPSTANVETQTEEVSNKSVGTQMDEESNIPDSSTMSLGTSISSLQVPDIILPTWYTPRSVPPPNPSPGLTPKYLAFCKKNLVSPHVQPPRPGTSRTPAKFMYECNQCNGAKFKTLNEYERHEKSNHSVVPKRKFPFQVESTISKRMRI